MKRACSGRRGLIRLRSPSRWLVLFKIFCKCSFQDRSSLSVTLKYLNVLACSRGLSLILIEAVLKNFRRHVLRNKENLDSAQLRVSRFEL